MTKTLLVSACLLLASFGARAACATTDFAIKDFRPGMSGPRLSLKGELVNNCATAAAAQIRIDLKDASGKVIQSKQAWPAGTSNISPGQSVSFDLGRMFRPSPEINSFTATVVDVRTW